MPTPGTLSTRVNGINYPPLHLQEDITNSIGPDQGVEELGWGIISHGLKSLAKPKTSNHLSNNIRRKKAKRTFELGRTDKDISTKYSVGGTGVNEGKRGVFPFYPNNLSVLIIGYYMVKKVSGSYLSFLVLIKLCL